MILIRVGIDTYLNSRLKAFDASLAALSLADARSQTSRTRLQSSGAAAVRKPVKDQIEIFANRPATHQSCASTLRSLLALALCRPL